MVRVSHNGETIEPETLSFLQSERRKALSLREWKFRIAGYGYAIKEIDGAEVVTSILPGGGQCVVPVDMI